MMRFVQTAVPNSIRSFVPSKRKYVYLQEKSIDHTRVAYGNEHIAVPPVNLPLL